MPKNNIIIYTKITVMREINDEIISMIMVLKRNHKFYRIYTVLGSSSRFSSMLFDIADKRIDQILRKVASFTGELAVSCPRPNMYSEGR